MASLKRLFDTCYPGLVRFLYRRLGDRDLAEDIAQEAFIRLLRESPERPEGWLFVVAANLARDAHRRDSRRARHLELLKAELGAVEVPATDLQMVREETVAGVRDGLARLSERDRTLLLLYEEGLAYRDLAAAVGVKESSIAPLLARARQRLLRQLKEGPHAPPIATASA